MKQLIIILGGNSPKNAAWTVRLAEGFGQQVNVYTHQYRHWRQKDADINFKAELSRLAAYLRKHEGDYSIIAKSAGALLALQGIANGILTPLSIVCIGLPLEYAAHRKIPLQQLVAGNTRPTLYIQANHDPAGDGAAVSDLTSDYGTFTSVEGDNHDYINTKKIVSLSIDFIKSNQTQ
jgi:predicted alpha/beta-hydrolase family hydrolase